MAPRKMDPLVRIKRFYQEDPETGCWVWTGVINKQGYGRFQLDGTNRMAHRAMWMLTRGSIAKGLQLDHLCRNRPCVNPDHLEPVTPRTNVLRSEAPTAKNAQKTHCVRGHEFNVENTQWGKKGRYCRACRRAEQSRYAAKQKANMTDLRARLAAAEAEIVRLEASRRAWAEEAMRLQDLVDKATVAMRDFRDRVRKVNAAEEAKRQRLLLELVEDYAPARPVCAVHPEGGE